MLAQDWTSETFQISGVMPPRCSLLATECLESASLCKSLQWVLRSEVLSVSPQGNHPGFKQTFLSSRYYPNLILLPKARQALFPGPGALIWRPRCEVETPPQCFSGFPSAAPGCRDLLSLHLHLSYQSLCSLFTLILWYNSTVQVSFCFLFKLIVLNFSWNSGLVPEGGVLLSPTLQPFWNPPTLKNFKYQDKNFKCCSEQGELSIIVILWLCLTKENLSEIQRTYLRKIKLPVRTLSMFYCIIHCK